MKARRVYLDFLLYAVFFGALFIIQDIGRAYGWWPKGLLKGFAVYVVFCAIFAFFVNFVRKKRWF